MACDLLEAAPAWSQERSGSAVWSSFDAYSTCPVRPGSKDPPVVQEFSIKSIRFVKYATWLCLGRYPHAVPGESPGCRADPPQRRRRGPRIGEGRCACGARPGRRRDPRARGAPLSRLFVVSKAGPGSTWAGPSIATFGGQSQIRHKGLADRTPTPAQETKSDNVGRLSRLSEVAGLKRGQHLVPPAQDSHAGPDSLGACHCRRPCHAAAAAVLGRARRQPPACGALQRGLGLRPRS